MPPLGPPGNKHLFFIGGMGKSGTTWVQILLNHHPEISCEGESHLINRFGSRLAELMAEHNCMLHEKNTVVFNETDDYPMFDQGSLDHVLRASCHALISRQKKFGTVRVIGEKTPDNVLHLPSIWRMFPQAKFIHVVRDGRDCAVSGWFHNQRSHPEWLAEKFGSMEA